MQHDEFIGRVQHHARLASRGDAERATRATLESLSDRLSPESAGNLAAQLPPEIGRHLLERDRGPERFDLHELFSRVGEREDANAPIAAHHARVVCGVVAEAVSVGEIAKIRAQLPSEFSGLFATPPPGPRD